MEDESSPNPSNGIDGATADASHHKISHNDLNAHLRSPSSSGLALVRSTSPLDRILSDAENDEMNAKIDRLVAVIEDCRPIHFIPNDQTGEVDIFADSHRYGADVSDDDDRDLERNIAALPENFGRIIQFGDQDRLIRSPRSLIIVTSPSLQTTGPLSESPLNLRVGEAVTAETRISNESLSNMWEKEVSNVDERYELDPGSIIGDDSPDLKSMQASVRDSRVHRARTQAVRDTPYLNLGSVSPIPLVFNRTVRSSTPSVYSNGSEQDCSSPLFQKSCVRMLQDTLSKPPLSEFKTEPMEKWKPNESISEWLARTKTPPRARKLTGSEGSSKKAFNVFHDLGKSRAPTKFTRKLAGEPKKLKDVSNLRRPGYLKFNSFASDKDSAIKPTGPAKAAALTTSSRPFGGASDQATRRSFIKEKWPVLLSDQRVSKMPGPLEAKQGLGDYVVGALDSLRSDTFHDRTAVVPSFTPNAAQQAHFDLALARLEGRTGPPPASPIRRYPDKAALRDTDIEDEEVTRRLDVQQPQPRRVIQRCVYQPRSDRPANSTPQRAGWHNVF